MKKLFYLLFIPVLISSCGSEAETETEGEDATNDSTTVESEMPESEMVFDDNVYATDWLIIRDAIVNADTETLENYNDSDGETQFIIDLCLEEWVLGELRELTYEELTETDVNGELQKEFYASVTSEVDGEEYGSAVSIYLIETDTGLKLVGYMAAG